MISMELNGSELILTDIETELPAPLEGMHIGFRSCRKSPIPLFGLSIA